jgi:hypothetical protein
VPHRNSYLGFPCRNCRRPVICLTIPREAATPIVNSAAHIHLTCQDCEHESEYLSTELTRFEAHQIT